jgi:hypothetical protein
VGVQARRLAFQDPLGTNEALRLRGDEVGSVRSLLLGDPMLPRKAAYRVSLVSVTSDKRLLSKTPKAKLLIKPMVISIKKEV